MNRNNICTRVTTTFTCTYTDILNYMYMYMYTHICWYRKADMTMYMDIHMYM